MTSKVKVVNKFAQFVEERERLAARAITQALVLGGSEAASLTPVHHGVLLNSAFRQVEKDGDRIVGTAGYTAAYALAVHEAKGKLAGKPRPLEGGRAQGVFWGPGGEPHFLKKGFQKAKPQIDSIFTGAMKV